MPDQYMRDLWYKMWQWDRLFSGYLGFFPVTFVSYIINIYLFTTTLYYSVGRIAQSVQRLATGWTVRAQNPGVGEIFLTCPDRPWGPPSLLYNGYRVFPGGEERPGLDADPSPLSSAVDKKAYSYTSTPPMGRTAFTEPQCLYKGAFYLYLTYIIQPWKSYHKKKPSSTKYSPDTSYCIST